MLKALRIGTLILIFIFAPTVGCFALDGSQIPSQSVSPPKPNVIVPSPDAPPADKVPTKPPANFFSSDFGISIAWIATIVSVILGIIPLILYITERSKSRLLNEVLEQFRVKETIEQQTRNASVGKKDIERALRDSKDELSKLTREIESNIPLQARAAFFNAAIPEIELQILTLSKQREIMVKSLSESGVTTVQTSALKNILDTEINATVMARRKLDEKQTILSIFTGFAAASAILDVFQPVAYPVSAILGFTIIWVSYDLGRQWALVYPETGLSRFIKSRIYRALPTFLGTILIVCFISASIYIWYRQFYRLSQFE